MLGLAGGQEFEAVHTWHVDVHEHDVRQVVAAAQVCKSGVRSGVAGDAALETGLLQHQPGHEVAIVLIVHEQDVPDGVGGRFSVLSPVGLFSAAMCGIDIDALLDGAAAMDARCSREQLLKNPAAMLALLLVELGQSKGKTNHVLMPYSNALYLLADWYRQLWAESLGKERNTQGEQVFAGFTPIKALGATDQHSQIQLYREGPHDKVIGLVAVDDFGTDVAIPTGLGVEALSYLEGKSMASLLNAERKATEYALVESMRPNYTITFPKIDAYHVGEFVMLWQVATAYAGLLIGVDAYDQPAVELGKQATFGLMGRKGYGEHLTNVQETLVSTGYVMKD